MRVRSTAVVITALAWLAVSVLPAAAQDKKAYGTVVSMAGSDLVVSVDGTDTTFHVDGTSNVIARGASTAQKAAVEMGKPGVTLADVLKKGDNVEVTYMDMDGRMHAKEIRAGIAKPQAAAPAAAGEKPKSATANGEVTAVAANSITVKSGADSWTFMIDAKTTVIGTGLGHMTKDMKEAEGKAPTLADVVGVGDQVAVTYAAMGDHKMASEVRVTKKK
jgi:hypothetical protein